MSEWANSQPWQYYSVICRPSDHTVGRTRAEIRTRDERSRVRIPVFFTAPYSYTVKYFLMCSLFCIFACAKNYALPLNLGSQKLRGVIYTSQLLTEWWQWHGVSYVVSNFLKFLCQIKKKLSRIFSTFFMTPTQLGPRLICMYSRSSGSSQTPGSQS